MPWATSTVLSGFCFASTRSSASAQASSENGSGSALSPCPGRSTITTRWPVSSFFAVGIHTIRPEPSA